MALKRVGITQENLKESKTTFQRFAEMLSKLRRLSLLKSTERQKEESENN